MAKSVGSGSRPLRRGSARRERNLSAGTQEGRAAGPAPLERLLGRSEWDYQVPPLQPPSVPVHERELMPVVGLFEIVNVLPDFDAAVTSKPAPEPVAVTAT